MSVAKLYIENDAVGLAALVKQRHVSARELVEVAISCIESLNPRLNAVISKRYDYARELAHGPLPDGPLSGVPFLLKDLAVEWEGFPVTNGSAFFRDYKATSSWEIAKRMKAAGLLPLGKTNVPENGYAGTTEPVFHGPTKNPWNPDLVPGGSSGGSAVAVASGMTPIADASDGGGSIRIPASLNGLVGLKPSRGRTTFGPNIVDFWYGAAVFLCVSRSVRDTAAYLDATAGAAPGEPYALPLPHRSYLSLLSDDGKTQALRIGVVTSEPNGAALGEEQQAATALAAKACEALGHKVEEASFKYDFDLMKQLFIRITATNAAAFFDIAPTLVGREVTKSDVEAITWEVIELGRSMTGVQHAKDVEAMRVFARSVALQIYQYDVFVTPTLPDLPHPTGWLNMNDPDFDTYNARLFRDMTFTAPFNLSGQPAVSLPLYQARDGAPLGVQFVGRVGDEATLITLAWQLEQALPWKGRRPKIFVSPSV
jgi:amidase